MRGKRPTFFASSWTTEGGGGLSRSSCLMATLAPAARAALSGYKVRAAITTLQRLRAVSTCVAASTVRGLR